MFSWGGSESIKECGLMNALKTGPYQLIDRFSANTPQEAREIYAKTVLSDYYFMSTNAITFDGELINIDGMGNRVACLIHGPKNVVVIVGMNKLVSDVETGYLRVRDMAAPANAKRLKPQYSMLPYRKMRQLPFRRLHVQPHCGNKKERGSRKDQGFLYCEN